MSEDLRRVRVCVEVDTNKQTHRFEFNGADPSVLPEWMVEIAEQFA